MNARVGHLPAAWPLALGVALVGALSAPAGQAQVDPPLNTVSPSAARCPDCAIVRNVREVRRMRPTPIGSTARDEREYRGPYQTGQVAPTLVGPTVGLAFGPGGADARPTVGARGTRRYLEALAEEDLEVTVQHVDGSFSRHEEPLESGLKPGDRVRVIDGRLERP
ncbi:MAG: hypothetical protein MUF30_02945 [Burkholderiales bacterium]|nr:hypothetical protein [Burkholderiales bacterium]